MSRRKCSQVTPQQAYRARKRAVEPDFDLRTRLEKMYGLSIYQYRAMLAKQDGKCAACRGVPPAGKRLQVDHDHQTGRVRGLLCGPCNLALGCINDDITRLAQLAEYLTNTTLDAHQAKLHGLARVFAPHEDEGMLYACAHLPA